MRKSEHITYVHGYRKIFKRILACSIMLNLQSQSEVFKLANMHDCAVVHSVMIFHVFSSNIILYIYIYTYIYIK